MVIQLDPADLLQRIGQHLEDTKADKKGDDSCGNDIVVKEIVTETRVPVIKLYDNQSMLEVIK